MYDIETNVCIASLPEKTAFQTVAGHRSFLAHKFQHRLNFRELPVSLLRLFFCGAHHFRDILRRIPNTSFKQLVVACAPVTQPTDDAAEEEEDFHAKMERVERALRLALDYTFCSFERTLRKVLACLQGHDTEWYHLGLFDALATDPWWRKFPSPISGGGGGGAVPLTAVADHVVWYCAVWRMNCTRLLERLVRPWHDQESEQWFLYRAQLYRDTHLDLLTVMVKCECYSDAALEQVGAMRTHYPTSNRCCCAEELPDLSPYAMDNLKKGGDLKDRRTLRDKIGHYCCIKTFNNICKDRNWWEIIRAYGEQHPLIYDHIKLCLKTAMLGNLPGALGALDLMARIRVNLSFWPEYADQVMSEAEIARFMPTYCNPYLVAEKKRAEKLAKEAAKSGLSAAKREQNMAAFDAKEQAKMAYVKTRFKMWLIKCRYFASSLMKEILFYTLESGRCIDEYLSVDLKWLQYKNIIRLANGQCRQELSQQAAARGLQGSFDWRQIEFIEKSPDGRYDVKSGKIMLFHNIALKVARKVMKRHFIGIIEIKSIGIEEKIALDRATPLPSIYCEAETPTRSKMTLDELFFICYCMATDENPVLKTAPFQLMGMSRQGLACLRVWLMEYYNYGVPDDSYKKKILKFVRNNLQDYLIMKTVFKIIGFIKKRCHVFYLSREISQRQQYALRRQLRICAWERTPESLGVCWQCYGCQKFANAVVVPLDYPARSNYAETTYVRHRIYHAPLPPLPPGDSIDQNVVLVNETRRVRTLEYHKDCFSRLGNAATPTKPLINDATKKKVDSGSSNREQEEEEEEKRRKKKEEEEKKRLKKNDNISFLNIGAYDITDGKPYCVRNKRKKLTGSVLVPEDARNVIMRTRNGEITISCNKVATAIVANVEANTDDTDHQCDSDDDDDDGDDNSSSSRGDVMGERHLQDAGMGGGGGGAETDEQVPVVRITRPDYEEDAVLLNSDISSLNSRDLARLHRYAIQHTQDLERSSVGGASGASGEKRKTPVENNKKRIHRAVMEPLHKRYSCERPMQAIDMVGIVKNGMVLCVECAVMTQYRNYNQTAFGPTCMRHRDASMMRNHYAWNAPNTPSVESIIATSGGGVGTKQRLDNTKRRQVHASLFVPDTVGARCHFCHTEPAYLYLVVYDAMYRLYRVECCLSCHTHIKTRAATTSSGGGGKHIKPQLHAYTEVTRYFRVITAV